MTEHLRAGRDFHLVGCNEQEPCDCADRWAVLYFGGIKSWIVYPSEAHATRAWGARGVNALEDLLASLTLAQSSAQELHETLHPVYCKRLNMVAGWLHQAQAVAERIGQDLEGAL